MNLIRIATKSHRPIRFGHQSQGLSWVLRGSPKLFSTEAEQSTGDASADPFLATPSTGLVFGKLFGISKYTTKKDILNLLEGCNLSLDDLKVDYNRSYTPTGMLIQFPSRFAYDFAIRAIARKGRLYRLDKADQSRWDLVTPYNGKAVLLQGIPRDASQDDVERFLSGCAYDASTIQIFLKQAFPDPAKMAIVRFPSPTQAMHAFITKNRGFCLNNQILVRVLH
ncbi:uncharacterized protein LOC127789568 isoform X2 [Diospyros lotus]|uniref:uncharacterized protein LOC127789568 isoform X2 n=1 Tax=Diospyros lotus TaxID=55363 RepID=UPI002251A585|nr:uncharacterized protein LOC127789568 isoform X2 [Diospyros lotus]